MFMDIIKVAVVAAIISENAKPEVKESREELWRRVGAEQKAADKKENMLIFGIALALLAAVVAGVVL